MSRTAPVQSPMTIDDCKAHIQAIYRQSPAVTLNISLTHSKIVQDAQASITGVYRHCFCVEEFSTGTRQCHTFTYADLLTGRVTVSPRE